MALPFLGGLVCFVLRIARRSSGTNWVWNVGVGLIGMPADDDDNNDDNDDNDPDNGSIPTTFLPSIASNGHRPRCSRGCAVTQLHLSRIICFGPSSA